MPFKRSFRKRRTFKRRRVVKKSTVAKIARRVVFRAAESKRLCTASSNAISSSWTTLQDFQSIPQGDTVSSRDGDSVRQMYLQFTGELIGAAGDVRNSVRFMVIESDQNADWGVNLPTYLYSCITPALRSKARILRDFRVTVVSPDNGTTGGNKFIKINLPLRGKRIKFASASTDKPEKRMLSLCMLSDSIAVAHPIIYWECTLTYKDI